MFHVKHLYLIKYLSVLLFHNLKLQTFNKFINKRKY